MFSEHTSEKAVWLALAQPGGEIARWPNQILYN